MDKDNKKIHIRTISDLKPYKNLIIPQDKKADSPDQEKQKSSALLEEMQEGAAQRKAVMQELVKMFEPICLNYQQCLECDFQWTSSAFTGDLAHFIYPQEVIASMSRVRQRCPHCGFRLPLFLCLLGTKTYIDPLVKALHRLVANEDVEGAVIFACIAFEGFLEEVVRFHLRQLETDSRVIEFMMFDTAPVISTYTKLLGRVGIDMSKDVNRMRELSDLRNDIIHRGKEVWDFFEVVKPLQKLAEFFIKHGKLYPHIYGTYNFWLDTTTGDISSQPD